MPKMPKMPRPTKAEFANILVCIYSSKYRVKSEVPVHTIKAYKRNRSTAPSILNLGNR